MNHRWGRRVLEWKQMASLPSVPCVRTAVYDYDWSYYFDWAQNSGEKRKEHVIIPANKNSARENPRAVIGRRSQGWKPYWLVTVYSIFKLLSLSLPRRGFIYFIGSLGLSWKTMWYCGFTCILSSIMCNRTSFIRFNFLGMQSSIRDIARALQVSDNAFLGLSLH